MGTRGNKPGARDFETNTEYGLEPETEQLKRLEDWKPDKTLFNAGTQAGFDTRRRDIVESYSSPYAGINNPVLQARMQDLALQEAEAQRARALGDQDTQYQRMSLEPISQAAQLRQQDRVKKKEWGFGQQQQQQGGGIGSALVQGGLGLLGGFL